ncbi:putative TPR domain protein [Prevotella sp. CAG:924]|nr:putative TPR domain protein [Prevotella sp. CAG:924]
MKKLFYTLLFLFAAVFLPIGWAGTKVSSLTFTDDASAASGHGKEVKKAILAARDQIKSGKNLDKAEQSMMTLLQDSDNLDNDKIWSTLFDALPGAGFGRSSMLFRGSIRQVTKRFI